MNQVNFLTSVDKAISALKKHDLVSKSNLNLYVYVSFTGTGGEVLTIGTAILNNNTLLSEAHQVVSENILKQLQYAGMNLNCVTSHSGDGNNYVTPNDAGFVSIAVGGINKKLATICVGVLADILEQNKIIQF